MRARIFKGHSVLHALFATPRRGTMTSTAMITGNEVHGRRQATLTLPRRRRAPETPWDLCDPKPRTRIHATSRSLPRKLPSDQGEVPPDQDEDTQTTAYTIVTMSVTGVAIIGGVAMPHAARVANATRVMRDLSTLYGLRLLPDARSARPRTIINHYPTTTGA